MTENPNIIEDCYFNYIDKTVTNLSSVMTTLRLMGSNNIIRKNTIHKTAASSTLNPGNEPIVEYNNLYDCIVTDQVPEQNIVYYFSDLNFLEWFKKKRNAKSVTKKTLS